MIRVRALFGALLALAAFRAAACSLPEPPSEEAKFAQAKEVFLARMVRVEETGKSERVGTSEVKTVQGTYKLIETFKGEPKDDGTILDFVFTPGNCSLGIMPGLYYLFFVGPENRLVLWNNGSRGYLNLDGSVPKRDLERFRVLGGKPAQTR